MRRTKKNKRKESVLVYSIGPSSKVGTGLSLVKLPSGNYRISLWNLYGRMEKIVDSGDLENWARNC